MIALVFCAMLAACGGDSTVEVSPGQLSTGPVADTSSPPVPTYSVGGTVSGLANGTTLQLSGVGSDSLTLAGNGTFAFPAAQKQGTAYAVVVAAQPANQSCSIANANGTVGSSAITDIAVTCVSAAQYSIGGSVAGLAVGHSVTLQNNGGDTLVVTAAGAFTFASQLASGAPYRVTVAGQPIGQACSISSGSGSVAAGNVTTVSVDCVNASSGTLTGQALDAATGSGIPGARIRVGSQSVTADASGNFTMEAVPAADRMVVVFEATNYAETARIVQLAVDATTSVQGRLLPVAASQTVNGATGGTVSVAGSSAQVVIPPNCVVRGDNTPVTGDVAVAVTPIAPASDANTMPGDFTTIAGGAGVPLESFGAMVVTLRDSGGAALNLASGCTSATRIPLSSRNGSPPASVPLYYFDTATGRWVEEGSATLAGTGAGRYYEGMVGHFSTWNADRVYETVQVTGCVVDENDVRQAGAVVQSDGIDYSGMTTARTNADGNFTIPMRINSRAALTALAGARLTNTLSVGPFSATTATLSGCLKTGLVTAGVTVRLTWGQYPSDLDSHLWAPNGAHVYYSSQGSLLNAPYASLDVDDTSSYGPEVITITRLMVGTYRYAVHNYSGYSSGPITASNMVVELNRPGQPTALFTPPTGETVSTNWLRLFELDVDERCNITMRRVPAFLSTGPSLPTGTTTYCTP